MNTNKHRRKQPQHSQVHDMGEEEVGEENKKKNPQTLHSLRIFMAGCALPSRALFLELFQGQVERRILLAYAKGYAGIKAGAASEIISSECG